MQDPSHGNWGKVSALCMTPLNSMAMTPHTWLPSQAVLAHHRYTAPEADYREPRYAAPSQLLPPPSAVPYQPQYGAGCAGCAFSSPCSPTPGRPRVSGSATMQTLSNLTFAVGAGLHSQTNCCILSYFAAVPSRSSTVNYHLLG